ncbi:A/G-specific adenine glycosylase [Legionella sp. km772]|uniref:A/G-specific adenine glycosylase n=1 Tax=Legionella sp. km772 TaxID=2498111 RepID=UPI000F8C87F5|nr:A/G-specific adenine glycosylase [Legionella sp. km772]RUR11972.1 A/G-specific adenine glycosylase [Legionella sp. km772]
MNRLEEQFSKPLLAWYDKHGRKNLPWQTPKDPYRIWVSEIMLQQTQVQTVIPYFNRFMEQFPTVHHLARAEEDKVLALWSGLGYYSRARNLHKTAKIISRDYSGLMPKEQDKLTNLPGIGPSTAAAILSQAYNLPAAILDGNVKRVLTRFFRIQGWPEQSAIKKMLWKIADECMPESRCAEYTQAIMDLGATCCTLRKPKCTACPVQTDCQALKYNEQHLYPTKKIKKSLPIEHQQFLVLVDRNRIYLEKRPPVGLWGGLWCFPSIDKDICPLTYIKKQYHFESQEIKHLTSLTHRFSHFQLEIDAILMKTQGSNQIVAEPQGQWFQQKNLKDIGLAKPTNHILNQLFIENKI